MVCMLMQGSEASLLPPSVDSVLSRRAIRVFALLSAGVSLRLCKLVTTVLAADTRVEQWVVSTAGPEKVPFLTGRLFQARQQAPRS